MCVIFRAYFFDQTSAEQVCGKHVSEKIAFKFTNKTFSSGTGRYHTYGMFNEEMFEFLWHMKNV